VGKIRGKETTDMPLIAVVNESTITPDAQVQALVPVLQKQVTGDFGPLWDVEAKITFYPKATPPPPEAWQLVILDTSDQAGALGYHDLTASNKPLGKVFAMSDQQAGDKLSVTVSHELLEILADPYINLTVQNIDGLFYAYEVCDAVEDDSLGYVIDGVTVSDFVLRSWFIPGFQGPTSFKGRINGAFNLAPGGYIGFYDPKAGAWNQKTNWQKMTYAGQVAPKPGEQPAVTATRLATANHTALKARKATNPPVGSRRERRTLGRAAAMLSTHK
jgi:hypothetical protein